MIKPSFSPENIRFTVSTTCTYSLGMSDVPTEKIRIIVRNAEGTILSRVTVTRIPSSVMRKNITMLGPSYNMLTFMHDALLGTIAEDMRQSGVWFTPASWYRKLEHNDLYQVTTLYVLPEYRRMGVGTWVLAHLQMMLTRITRDIEPVIVLLPPLINDSAPVKPWLMRMYDKAGFKPIHATAKTLYFNPTD